MQTISLRIDPAMLRRYRLQAALTQIELARKAGVARVTVSRLEQGGPASTVSVRRLAVALNVDVTDIAQVVIG